MARQRRSDENWHRLDNTANLFPVITNRKYSNVYRVAMTLDETIDPELLQRALDTALPWFAAFKVRLRHGLFWHYLEGNAAMPLVSEEDDYPCRYIDPKENRQFLFRVTYYGKRINLEVYHALTDGTGALRLLMALVCQYLLLAHPTAFTEEDKTRHWFAEHAGDIEDSYAANYVPTKKSNFRVGKAMKITGERNTMEGLGVLHAYVGLAGLKAHCKALGVTVGQYLTAVIAYGIYTEQLRGHPAKYPVNVFLPVNLRPIFQSTTSLNFFSNIFIIFTFDREGITFEEILDECKKQFEEKVSRENMLQKISYTVGGGYSAPVRVVPLPLKKLFLRLIYESSAGSSSISFTNVGVVQYPPQFARYVAGAYAMLSTAPREPFKIAALSYNDTLTLTFTSTLRSTALQRGILRRLRADGMEILVETNGVYDENL